MRTKKKLGSCYYLLGDKEYPRYRIFRNTTMEYALVHFQEY